MSTHVVPHAVVVHGPAPTVDRRKKKEPVCHCGLPVTAHSGDRCGICRDAVEHHTDTGEMAGEITRRARLADARQHAGLPLTPVDQWCLDQVGERQAAA